LRMTPPRSDNWAGVLGMFAGLMVYCARNGLLGVIYASLVSGVIGGMGFALATMFKLMEMTSGLEANYHSILEQTYGLINGLGIAVTMLAISRFAPSVKDDPPVRRWTDWYAPALILLLVTWLNLSKNPEEWVKQKAMPAIMYGLTAQTWFN